MGDHSLPPLTLDCQTWILGGETGASLAPLTAAGATWNPPRPNPLPPPSPTISPSP